MRFGLALICLFLITCVNLQGQRDVPIMDTIDGQFTCDTVVKFEIVKDDPIVKALDDLAKMGIFKEYYMREDSMFYKQYDDMFLEPTVVSDSIIRLRINQMAIESPMDYVFNSEVKAFINLYAVRKFKYTQRMVGLSYIYFPLFESMLDKYNMPLELKYLAVVESALNPGATSSASARGMWQFMVGTGKMYGLNVTSYIDDRCDVFLSTDAACRHLRDLYKIYNDWWLALAAYNAGPGNVNKAIRRSGGKRNFWEIFPYLPKETRGYVPAFIAVSYVMNYAESHNLYPIDPGVMKQRCDTVMIKRPLMLNALANTLGLDPEYVQLINPRYKKGFVPASTYNQMSLNLPETSVIDFINNEKALFEFIEKNDSLNVKAVAEVVHVEEVKKYHKVKSGDNLSIIANKYGTTVSNIMALNGLRSSRISIGQNLLVRKGSYSSSKTELTQKAISGHSSKTHTVRSGENLTVIARRYNCDVSDIKKWNNLRSSGLQVGQKLKIY